MLLGNFVRIITKSPSKFCGQNAEYLMLNQAAFIAIMDFKECIFLEALPLE
jgi:hypothetical protein